MSSIAFDFEKSFTMAGIAWAKAIADIALSTDVGIKGSLYAGLITAATRSGIQNGTLVLNALQSIPSGTMMLQHGPNVNNIFIGLMQGLLPPSPTLFINYEILAAYGIGYFIGELNN